MLYLKLTNDYYQKHKEKFQKEAHGNYRNISEEKRDKKQKKAQERYQSFTKEEKKLQCHRLRNKNLSEE